MRRLDDLRKLAEAYSEPHCHGSERKLAAGVLSLLAVAEAASRIADLADEAQPYALVATVDLLRLRAALDADA